MTWDEVKHEHTLENMPENWNGHTKESKVNIITEVVDSCMRDIRNGVFPTHRSQEVAALALEGQMCLADFYTDAEAAAKNAKHIAEYIEAETSAKIAEAAVQAGEKRPSEVALKRKALVSDEVKEAKKQAINLERQHKKWRCILEILKEAHVFFRRISTD
jgi:hypothetical protein